MAPRTLAIMNPPIAVIRIAANLLRFPTTMYADETNASVVQTEANHINLLITSTTLLSDFISLLTTVICTTTTAKDVKSATALEMKKILKAAVPATTALPSSSSPPGTVKIAEKATVANSTATTVTELVALLIPSLWSFLSSLAIPFMFCSFPLIAPIRPKLSFISAISSERGSPSAMSSAVLLSLELDINIALLEFESDNRDLAEFDPTSDLLEFETTNAGVRGDGDGDGEEGSCGCDDGGGGAREIRMPRHEDAAGAIQSLF
nr:hypothetical protein TorRG33x02_127810 [Ipomoea batatas]